MRLARAVSVAAIVVVTAVVQTAALSSLHVLGGGPDLLLVALVAIALLHGSIVGGLAGFAAGLLLDVATLGTLGVTALLLTLAGYWAGRYGETTGRGRAQAPVLAVAAITLLAAGAAYLFAFLLGESVPAPGTLLAALPAMLLNAALAVPVYRLVRRLTGGDPRVERRREAQLLA